MNNTNIDEIVEYPIKALRCIGENDTIAKLLTNNANLAMDSDEAYAIYDKYLFDYQYVDNTTQETSAYICVEAEMPRSPTPTMKSLLLYVNVLCHKQYMKLDASQFPGLIGNRRDNLTRYVDSVLNGSDIFGIGKLKLTSVRTTPAPPQFTSRELIYIIPDFNQGGAS